MADQNCAHGGCNCKVEQGRGVTKGNEIFCSDQCANAGTAAQSGGCGCGHADCR